MDARSRETVLAALGESRIQPYLNASGGNRKNALNLYRWAVRLNAAVQETLGLTEVVLRNAIDAQLQAWNNSEFGHETSWLLEAPATPLRALVQGKRLESIRRAEKERDRRPMNHPRSGEPITHDDVLANTMFGLWKDILPNHAPDANPAKTENRNRGALWEAAVKSAFPHAQDSTGELTYWRVTHLHSLRNRVSHMDSLLNVDVKDLITNDAFGLINSINPRAGQWVTGTSPVPAVLKERPRF